MKLGTIERIRVEEIPSDSRKWMKSIVSTINSFFSDVIRAINGNLSINDNTTSKIKTYDYIGDVELKIKNPLSVKPIGVIILNIKEQSQSPTTITDPVTLYWAYEDTSIVIKDVTNVVANTKYSLTLLIVGG